MDPKIPLVGDASGPVPEHTAPMAATTPTTDLDAECAALHRSLLQFTHRPRPLQGARATYAQINEPHVRVRRLLSDAEVIEAFDVDDVYLVHQVPEQQQAVLGIRFEIESPDFGASSSIAEGPLDAILLVGPDEPDILEVWVRASCEAGMLWDFSPYGPDYDAIQGIVALVDEICELVWRSDPDDRAQRVAMLAQPL